MKTTDDGSTILIEVDGGELMAIGVGLSPTRDWRAVRAVSITPTAELIDALMPIVELRWRELHERPEAFNHQDADDVGAQTHG